MTIGHPGNNRNNPQYFFLRWSINRTLVFLFHLNCFFSHQRTTLNTDTSRQKTQSLLLRCINFPSVMFLGVIDDRQSPFHQRNKLLWVVAEIMLVVNLKFVVFIIEKGQGERFCPIDRFCIYKSTRRRCILHRVALVRRMIPIETLRYFWELGLKADFASWT